MKRLVMALVFGLLLPAAAAAQDLESLEKLRAAAENGDPSAQLEMGILYEYGFNLPNNKPPALAWYMLAAAQGNQRAIERRELLQRRMTQAEIDEARRLASEYESKRTRPAAPPGSGGPAAESSAPAR